MEGADITVVTLTMPDRSRMDLLERNVDSVKSQTVAPAAHLVDDTPGDFGDLYNGLIAQAQTPFVMILDDDCWLEPHHIETVVPFLGRSDVVYTWDSSGSRPRVNVNHWSHQYIERLGQDFNWLDPNGATIRASKFRDIGGFAGAEGTQLKDWDLWRRMVGAHATFYCVPEVTWRFGQWVWDGHVTRDVDSIFNNEERLISPDLPFGAAYGPGDDLA